MKTIKKAFLVSIVLLVLCGIIYPLALTGISQVAFNHQANGSMIEVNGVAVGSEHVGQDFTDERFFKGRPSAYNYNTYTEADITPDAEGNTAYGGVSSGSQNMSATNPALTERVEADMEEFLKANPEINKEDIPADLLTASGSGLDPDISPQAAKVQIPAISVATGLTEEELQEIVNNNTSGKVLGIFGENKVNVLMTNIEVAKAIGII